MSDRQIIITEDGSHSILNKEIDESYHSSFGAVNESMHIFINAGLNAVAKKKVSIIEVGFGTGLNAFLTALESTNNNFSIDYTTIEKFPLERALYSSLNFAKDDLEKGLFNSIHEAKWGVWEDISDSFRINKLESDLLDVVLTDKYDLVYFDAFSPDKQPELWSEDVFKKIYNCLNEDAVIVTYCAKGYVRRTLQSVGFTVERLPGPKGKREILRGRKVI